MADSVTPRERRTCWLVMSDLFVDNELDYNAVAEALVRDCPNMTKAELKRTPAPSVWTGFEGDAVIRDVGDRLARQHLSLFAKVRGSLWNAACRVIFRSFWTDLQRELQTLGKV